MATYKHQYSEHNLSSPKIIVPHLIKTFSPASVIDVGCGLGTFLSVFDELGVHDYLGIEGEWVNKDMLFIDEKHLQIADLNQPLQLGRKFDLAICLEVAEHLKTEASSTIVKNLTDASDLVVFSAAITNQGGQNHINEQPYEFWIDLFDKAGYVVCDIFRDHFWEMNEVQWWYKQNMFLFVKKGTAFEKLQTTGRISTYIHPQLLEEKNFVIKNREKEIAKLTAQVNSFWPPMLTKNKFLKDIKRRISKH